MSRVFGFIILTFLLVSPLSEFCLAQSQGELEDDSLGYKSYMQSAYILRAQNRHYEAAKYFFQAALRKVSSQNQAFAYAEVANSLTSKGLYQSASYFYLKAIGSGSDRAIRRALRSTQKLIENLGGGVFRKYLLSYTNLSQFSPKQRDFYLYFRGMSYLLGKEPRLALRSFSSISDNFYAYPQALFLKGTSNLLLGRASTGRRDFIRCSNLAKQGRYRASGGAGEAEQEDLYNRCLAGIARALYQEKRYRDAEIWYSKINIKSVVWPQILYEWAWAYVAQGKYNHALGKLVSYKAPILDWFLNSEVSLLRALSYMQLCLYEDVSDESKYFVKRYGKLGLRIKKLLNETARGRKRDFEVLFNLGTRSVEYGTHKTKDPLLRFMSKFINAPYFTRIAKTDRNVANEESWIRNRADKGRGLSGFLLNVLDWRKDVARKLGGLYVRERLDTEYRSMLKNVQMMDIVKLEILQKIKSKLQNKGINRSEDEFGNEVRGSLGKPNIFSDQYFWTFNGEFWIDELGDYIFALRSECA